MMNVRGNQYSRKHVKYDTCSSCEEFWDFGIEEPGLYDYPASIDYILNTTNQEDLFYIGYSMGSSHYFIMLSELPEYNQKIKAGFVMGPAVFLGNNLPLNLATPFLTGFLEALDWFNFEELATRAIADLSHYTCTKGGVYAFYCHFFWEMIANTDDDEMDLRTSLIHVSNTPSGKFSIKALELNFITLKSQNLLMAPST